MILVFDVGNTRVKWGWAEGRSLLRSVGCLHRGQPDWQLAKEGPQAVDAAYAVSVGAASVNERLAQLVRRRWGCELHMLRSQRRSGGVTNGYAMPQQLGADRWAAVVGAHARGHAACVFDCGSAVTVDAVTQNGEHLGGMILPGLAMMRRALREDTASLPLVEHGPVELLARDSDTGIRSGTLLGLAGTLDALGAAIQERLREPLTFYITGGDAEELSRYMRVPLTLAPNLVLEGLVLLAEEVT
jgi:type III pantothenate kinase